MSKAEDYIRENKRDGSNEFGGGPYDNEYVSPYYYWLTPSQARKAVEIAREEIYEWLRVNLCNYFDAPRSMFEMCLDDLKQAVKDE